MHRFYWLIEGELAGCSRPGAGGSIESDLLALRSRGIGALLTLTETALPHEALARHDIRGLHLPVNDFHAPTTEQMLAAMSFLDDARATGAPAAVHCLAGQGRTGTVLAAFLIRGGLPAREAIAEVRAACPGAIESPPQLAALDAWAAERPWII